jgi:tRNA C32,U32 (ribose-2'-O)-methylase TrmJ
MDKYFISPKRNNGHPSKYDAVQEELKKLNLSESEKKDMAILAGLLIKEKLSEEETAILRSILEKDTGDTGKDL